MNGYRDPGWWVAFRRSLPFVLIPFFPLTLAVLGRSRDLDHLTLLRIMFLHFVSALVTFFVVVMILFAGDPAERVSPVAYVLLAGYAVVGTAGVAWARSRELDSSTQERLAASYRALFFMAVAFAMSVALGGFVATFLVGALWPYLVGVAIAIPLLVLAAPSRRDIERRQQQLTGKGSTLSLAEALGAAAPGREPSQRA